MSLLLNLKITLWIIWVKPYCLYCLLIRVFFAFEKNWSMFSKCTIKFNSNCLWFKSLKAQRLFKQKKWMSLSRKLDRILAEENKGQTTVSLTQFFNKFLTPIDTWALGECFYKTPERTIWVKPYYPW